MKSAFFLLFTIAVLFSCTENRQKNGDNKNALEILKEGNLRFQKGHPIHPHETSERLKELNKGQHPFAIVVSCSDSRVPPELIFDQGLGDIFSIRTAGNVIGDYELGSIEYAVEHLHCNLVVVLGHSNCGAVDAYIHSNGEQHNDHIQTLINYIAAEQEEKELPDTLRQNIDIAVTANIIHDVNFLKTSEPVLKELAENGKLKIIGGVYHLDNGEVEFVK